MNTNFFKVATIVLCLVSFSLTSCHQNGCPGKITQNDVELQDADC